MATINFKSQGEGDAFHDYVRGWFALGDHGIHQDGTHLLSAECVTLAEAEEAARYLHKEIDSAMAQARREFTGSLA